MHRRSSDHDRSPRTLLAVAGAALLIAGCSALTLDDGDAGSTSAAPSPTSGDGWALLAEAEGGPEAGPTWASMPSDPPRARAAADQQQLEEAWDELGLAGSPPEVDHDTTLAVLYTSPFGGTLEEVLLVGDQVRISIVDPEVGDGSPPRTLLFGLDRDALDDVPALTWGGNPMDEQRPMATSVREEPLAFPEDRGPFEATVEDDDEVGPLIVVRATSEDPVPGAADDPLPLLPDEVVLWRWDGLQWRDVPIDRVAQAVPSELPDDDGVVAAVGIGPAEGPDVLEEGTYVAHVVPPGGGAPSTDDGQTAIVADPPRVVVPFEVRDEGRTIELRPAHDG